MKNMLTDLTKCKNCGGGVKIIVGSNVMYCPECEKVRLRLAVEDFSKELLTRNWNQVTQKIKTAHNLSVRDIQIVQRLCWEIENES